MPTTFRERLCPLPDLVSEVFALLQQVPDGCVTTYGDLARALGDFRTRSARWLGELLKNHTHTDECPCHRVIRSNGQVGHYVTGNVLEKVQRLQSEGTLISPSGIVDLGARFANFQSGRSLAQLQDFQLVLAQRRICEPYNSIPKRLAGLDCSYPSPGIGLGTYVELDAETLTVIFEDSLSMPISFPYLPGFLAFRELPIMLSLLDQVIRQRDLADILFVDGNGTLHPWSAGIATCLGVLIEHPTIGISKSLLCGSVDLMEMKVYEQRPVVHAQETIGTAIQSTVRSRPIFVSPGERVTLADANRIAMSALAAHRLPEPVFFADRLSKRLR